ncbi:MAG: hypothetical protein GX442_03000 [Candidatus Riflebacteria bacterium]|nr:hypothetical protein [Candidatus Riflebacteria bacterium]
MMLNELYLYFGQIDHCLIPTLLAVFLFFGGWMALTWSNAAKIGMKDTPAGDWVQIIFCGVVCFICAVSCFGFLFFAENTENFLDALGLFGLIKGLAVYVQRAILWCFRLVR